MSIYKINLNDQLVFRSGKKYKLKEGCIVGNLYYQSTKNDNTDHPLMGKSWRHVVDLSVPLLSSTTEVLSSSSLPNSTTNIT